MTQIADQVIQKLPVIVIDKGSSQPLCMVIENKMVVYLVILAYKGQSGNTAIQTISNHWVLSI